MTDYTVRPAKTQDVPKIQQLVAPLVRGRVLLGKDPVVFYESVPEFLVAQSASGEIIGCGALHIMWQDLGEVRTIAAAENWRGKGVGHNILQALIGRAGELGLSRLFCLTFETGFFGKHGFKSSPDIPVDPEVRAELLRSPDEGVAEFLDLERVKPNTLGNTRMLLHI